MKCGILTINVNLMNYGNRLQNYALQTALEKLGNEVLTVKYHPSYERVNIQQKKRMFVTRLIKGVYRRSVGKIMSFRQNEKKRKFDLFVNKQIKWTEEDYYYDSDFSILSQKFDYMIAGSDQIWNPYWEGTNPIYFMEFMPQDRRISYAASFGVSNIPEDKKEYFRVKLLEIPSISVREDRGVTIVKELTGHDVVRMIDPVFLLSREEWEAVAKKPKGMRQKKYLLVYLLGDCSKAMQRYIGKYIRERRLGVIYLDKFDKFSSLFASPDEFIYLIMNAETILTDSFHGAAFAIIFHKSIVYWNRSLNNGADQDMSSRLLSLFKIFGYIQDDAELKSPYMIFDNFDEKCVDDVIQEERKRGYTYLKNVVKKNEKGGGNASI